MRLFSNVLRLSTPIITLLTITFAGAAPAKACSLVMGVDTQLPDADWAVPSNEVFKFWHHAYGTVSGAIVDASGKRVPAAITTTAIPIAEDLDAPFYSVLRPFRPLVTGNYEFQTRMSSGAIQTQKFSVHSGTDRALPLAPQKFAATLEAVSVMVELNADCSPIMKKRAFLVLKTEDGAKETQPKGALVYNPIENPKAGLPLFTRTQAEIEKSQPTEALTYNLTWVPIVNGRPDEKRKLTIFGLRPQAAEKGVSPQLNTFLIPVSAFKSLKPSDRQIQLSLVAEDGAGMKSQPARFIFDTRDLLKRRNVEAKELRPTTHIPIDEELTKDLRRFREASVAIPERDVFDLIQPIAPSERGVESDSAFKKGIEEQEGQTISVQGIIPAKNAQFTIKMPVLIENGKVRPLVSKPFLQRLLADLPLAEPAVEKLDIEIGVMGFNLRKRVYSGVSLQLKGQNEPQNFSWSQSEPTNVRAAVRRMIGWYQIIERNDYYRILNSKYEGSSPQIYEDMDNANNANVYTSFTNRRYSTSVSWTIQSGIVKLSSVEGTFSDLSVGELEKPLQQLAQFLNISA